MHVLLMEAKKVHAKRELKLALFGVSFSGAAAKKL
jgi:hypothetical protein